MLGSAKMLLFDKAFKGALSRYYSWAVQLNSMPYYVLEYDIRGFVNRAETHRLAKRKASARITDSYAVIVLCCLNILADETSA